LFQSISNSIDSHFAKETDFGSQCRRSTCTIGASASDRLSNGCNRSLSILKQLIAGEHRGRFDVAIDISHNAQIAGFQDGIIEHSLMPP
jgi:hypothetical protein